MCDNWFGTNSVNHNLAKEHFLGFDKTEASRKGYGMWRIVSLIIVWYVWKHKNDIIFKNRKCDIQEVFVLVQVKSWTVIRAKYNKVSFTFSNWYLDPLMCMTMTN